MLALYLEANHDDRSIDQCIGAGSPVGRLRLAKTIETRMCIMMGGEPCMEKIIRQFYEQ